MHVLQIVLVCDLMAYRERPDGWSIVAIDLLVEICIIGVPDEKHLIVGIAKFWMPILQ
jgi:hypothetical protein